MERIIHKPMLNGEFYVFLQTNRAQILDTGDCPKNTLQGVAGKDVFINNGKPV